MKKHILVTGGAGYIGRHLCARLAQLGCTPISIDNLTRGDRAAVRWGPLCVGDVRDIQFLRRCIEENDVDTAVHLAAKAYVGESFQDPSSYYDNNVTGMLSLLRAVTGTKVKRIVFSSTCSSYDPSIMEAANESSPVVPSSPYAATKVACEEMLRWFVRANECDVRILRFFNAAGAWPDAGIGEDHNPETHLIPVVVQAGLGRRGPVQVFGGNFPTPDGTAIRDYVHVRDIAEACTRVLQNSVETGRYEIYNLGYGTGVSVMDVLEAASSLIGKPIPFFVGDVRPGDPAVRLACIEKAKRELGWAPVHSSLEGCIASCLEWEQLRTNAESNVIHVRQSKRTLSHRPVERENLGSTKARV